MKKAGFIGLIALVGMLTGCQTPTPLITRGVVYNNTPREIKEVMVTHRPTKQNASVTAIMPRETLDIGFSQRPLFAETAMVTWDEGNVHHEVSVKIPVLSRKGQHDDLMLVYEIRPKGWVRAYLSPAP